MAKRAASRAEYCSLEGPERSGTGVFKPRTRESDLRLGVTNVRSSGLSDAAWSSELQRQVQSDQPMNNYRTAGSLTTRHAMTPPVMPATQTRACVDLTFICTF
jgi:hypothetical protein